MKNPFGRDDPQGKMRELILYISRRSECDPDFGAVKLNKILFFSDFQAYLELGKAVTEAEYQKLEFGPAPKKLLPVRRAMENSGDLAVQCVSRFGETQVRTVALREPDLSKFSADEIAMVDRIITAFAGMNAAEVSDLSHRFCGWKLAEIKETIPYEIALVGGAIELSESERAHAASLQGVASALVRAA